MSDHTRILILEDVATDAELNEREARRVLPDCEFLLTETRENFLKALKFFKPDLILADYKLPQFDGLSALKLALEHVSETPFIVVTGSMNEDTAVECMKAGAWDYVIKEHIKRLGPAILNGLEQKRVRAERRRIESRIVERHATLNAILESADFPIFSLDRQYCYTSFNRAHAAVMKNLYGTDIQIGRSLAEFQTAAEDWKSAKNNIDRALQGETVFESLCSGAEGFSRRYFEVTHHPIRTAAGEIIGISIFAKDVTEHKQMQASVAQTDRLASMGMLAAGVAHEINNPLTYVLYNLKTLAQDLPNLLELVTRCCSALREKLGNDAFSKIAGEHADLLQPTMSADYIHRALEAFEGTLRIKEITRSLSTFSRTDRFAQSKVALESAIQYAANMAKNEIKHRAKLVSDFGDVPPILASEGKLSQVFLNLLINAAHAIEEGDVENNTVKVRTWTEGGNVCAEVSDTGKGIPLENLERIFEPFYTTKPAGQGTGLGLTICKNIIAEFGGDIRVESQVGKGSRFVIRLPKMADAPDATPQSLTPQPPMVLSRRGRILVIEDEEEIRWIIKRMLDNEHDVVTASSGEEGKLILEQDSSFDQILCNLIMARMSGINLHAWLAARNPSLAARVIFMTGGADSPKTREYLAQVKNPTIEKPFAIDEVRRIVNERIHDYRKTDWSPKRKP